MCGIVGYTGKRQAQPILLDGLARLEYRGYDSAGIAVMAEGRLQMQKAKGQLSNLAERVASAPLAGCAGIGHTRWATHGEPSDINAHPHTDMKNGIAVVHNGIIENHGALRAMLQAKGCVFSSETDTEVIAHLLSVLDEGDMFTALCRAQPLLEGSYALGVLCAQSPGVLYCMRHGSPLVLGLGGDGQFMASDIPAIIPHTREILLPEDRDIAVLEPGRVRVFSPCGTEKPLQPIHVDWDVEAAEKGGYAHFMLKEIHEEPVSLRRTFTAHADADALQLRPDAFPIDAAEARTLKGVTIVACGTAYHAGVAGKYVIERLARLPVTVDLASEFRYREPVLEGDDLCIAISQSGETADTLAALREARRLGCRTLSLTNAVGSSITRESGGRVMYTHAGPEISVASTKAYITQVEALLLFAVDLAVKRGYMDGNEARALLAEMANIPGKAEQLLACEGKVQRIAGRYSNREHVFYIGRGLDNALAMEASLKLKEVSYIISEAYAAGELKHGAIALIEEGTLVCALLTQKKLAEKTLANVREVRSRGAKTLLICTENLAARAALEADDLLVIPDCRAELAPLLAVIPVQLLAYYMAVSRGCDVDRPRNLAKSVTVE